MRSTLDTTSLSEPQPPYPSIADPLVAVIHETPKDETDDNIHGWKRFSGVGKESVIHLDPEHIQAIDFSEKTFEYEGETHPLPPMALLRDGANTSDRTLEIYRQFEQGGVQTLNSAAAIENARDKWRMAHVFRAHNLPHPKTILLQHDGDDASRIRLEFGPGPFIIKRPRDVQGRGVFLIPGVDHLDSNPDLTKIRREKQPLIAQQYIASSHGRDLRVFVLDGHVHGVMQRICTDPTDFKANCSQSGRGEAFTLTPEIEDLALRTAAAIGLDIAGVDLLFTDSGYTLCEVNSSPGFKALDKALGLNTARTILDLARHRHHQAVAARIGHPQVEAIRHSA